MNRTDFIYQVIGGSHPLGTAFLVDQGFLITCAHVISQAVHKSDTAPVDPGTKVFVQRAQPGSTCVEAVVRFHVSLSSVLRTRDVALLELEEKDYPVGAGVPCWRLSELEREMIKSFGFPEGVPNGVHAEGSLIDADGQGWWQSERLKAHGASVRGGMSGAPAFSNRQNALIGMISSADKHAEFFSVIPIEVLRQAVVEHNRATPRRKLVFRILPETENEVINGLQLLNFEAQYSGYSTYPRRPCAALILHGPYRHGQDLIANRILSHSFVKKEPWVIPIEYGRAAPANPEDVLTKLAQRFGDIRRPIRRDVILNALVQRLERQHVLLVLRTGIHTASTDAMARLFAEFWTPLIQTLKGKEDPLNQLLLLILDDSGGRKRWPEFQIASPDGRYFPEAPIELPELSRIPRDEVVAWIREKLPRLDVALSAAVLADAIWPRSEDGLPESVFEEFCGLFNLEWDTEASKCLLLRK
jgi:hypothetical protein